MTTIHLSDVQRDQFTTSGLIVVDGDYGGLKMNAIQEPYYVVPEQWSGVVTLTATCPRDNHDPETGRLFTHLSTGERALGNYCTCKAGVVTLGRFTIQALPVWLNSEERDHQVPHACVGDHGLMIVSEGGYMLPVPLDPLPQPGQFVLAFTEVAS